MKADDVYQVQRRGNFKRNYEREDQRDSELSIEGIRFTPYLLATLEYQSEKKIWQLQ